MSLYSLEEGDLPSHYPRAQMYRNEAAACLKGVHDTPPTSQRPIDLAYLFLNFAGYLFIFAFSFQVGIVDEFPGDFLDLK